MKSQSKGMCAAILGPLTHSSGPLEAHPPLTAVSVWGNIVRRTQALLEIRELAL